MIGQLSNKKIFLSSFFIILICSLLFQFSISDKVLQSYYSSVGESTYDIGEKSVRTIVMFLQGFMIFTTFVEILIGGFLLFVAAFILGTKKPKKIYLLLYTLYFYNLVYSYQKINILSKNMTLGRVDNEHIFQSFQFYIPFIFFFEFANSMI